ncbi:MAG: transcriptional regulator, partial [Mesorhizobium sp.]
MTLPHPTADQISLSNVLAVLGDPTRLAIVRYLASK